MNEIKYSVGDKIIVTLPKYSGHVNEYEILSTTIKDDGRGTIQLKLIKESHPDVNKWVSDGTIVVESLWFNVPEYRKIKLI